MPDYRFPWHYVKSTRSTQNANNFVLAMVNHHEDGYVLGATSQM